MTPIGDDLSLRKRRQKKLPDNELAMPFEALFAVTDFIQRAARVIFDAVAERLQAADSSRAARWVIEHCESS